MKKIIICILLLFSSRIYALEDIKINNETLSPIFDKNIKVYNYFTDKDTITIKVKSSNNETITGTGIYEIDENKRLVVESNLNGKYVINVYKNYTPSNEPCYFKSFTIDNYDIAFENDNYEYSIDIGEEENLKINYELSNDNCYVSILGNGNFNRNNNLIEVNIDNVKYNIHVHKTINTFYEVKEDKTAEFSNNKKEIIKLVIIIISSILVFLFYYTLFINKKYLHI